VLSYPVRAHLLGAALIAVILAFLSAATRQTSPPPADTSGHSTAPHLNFLRAFSSPGDIKSEHEILNRALDIVAGPADPIGRTEALKSPVALVSDSRDRVFVADPGAKAVHIFDFAHSRYAQLDSSGRFTDPVALATDAQDNLLVADQINRTILLYDASGKFRRTLGRLRGGESYFESPTSIAVDHATGHIYVCDRFAHMIFVMDQRGKILRRIGKRGGGQGPAEFRLPSHVLACGSQLCVLDAGNNRIQILDASGHFQRAINVGYAGHGAGFATDPQGNLYLSDPAVDQIQVFRLTATAPLILDFSTTQAASMVHPSALWVDANRKLYVIDSQQNRVVEFEIVGQRP
jgi:DNA-binding beta-propeller fold protein YncE